MSLTKNFAFYTKFTHKDFELGQKFKPQCGTVHCRIFVRDRKHFYDSYICVCLLIYNSKLFPNGTWNEASKACQSIGGDLPVIRSNEEQNEILSILKIVSYISPINTSNIERSFEGTIYPVVRNQSCSAILPTNLAIPEWITINCDEPITREVFCTLPYDKHMQKTNVNFSFALHQKSCVPINNTFSFSLV